MSNDSFMDDAPFLDVPGSESTGEAVAAAPTGNAAAAGYAGSTGATGVDSSAALGGAGGEWFASLPEGMREAARGAGSLEKAADALKRGLAHVPLTSAEKVDLAFPDGIKLNDRFDGWMRSTAVEAGLSASQLSALAAGYGKHFEEVKQAASKECRDALAKEYGVELESKMEAARKAVALFDKQSGGSLRELLHIGLGNNASFVKAMAVIGEAVSESSLPGGAGFGGGSAEMSGEDFLKEIFEKARAGKL